MASCTHTQWLDLTRRDARWTVSYGMRMRRLLQTFSAPDEQFPSLLFFVGARAKILALQDIFPHNDIRRREAHGVANLHVDLSTTTSKHPIFFADCNPTADFVDQINGWTGCHETTRHRLEWLGDPNAVSLQQKITSQLLFSFTDVICIFVEDLGGVQKVFDLLAQWASFGTFFCPDQHVAPSVILVGEGPLDLLSQSCEPLLPSFPHVKYVQLLASRKQSRHDARQELRETLLRSVESIRDLRTQIYTRFSASHFTAIFELGLVHFVKHEDEPFDILRATRSCPFPHHFTRHISSFLTLCLERNVSEDMYSSFIAGAISLDSSPPASHRKSLSIVSVPTNNMQVSNLGRSLKNYMPVNATKRPLRLHD
jgi:hypothetical protein